MLDALKKLFGGKEKSGRVADKRLRVVLMQDRVNMSPEVMAKLKDDIIQVISRYMVINKQDMELTLENDDNSFALVANIPVRQVKHS